MIQEVNELMTAGQLARRLNVRPRTVQKWARMRLIPSVRISYKVIRYEWQKVVEALCTGGVAQKSPRRKCH
jgi:hypothetical protein